MVDGDNVLPLATSQDHTRVGDADTGPNTGGMGAYSPAPVVTAEVHQRVMDEVIYPTVRGMAAEGNVYTGFLYAGLMIDKAGKPKVIEFNCRFGDPETQPIMVRLESSLVLLVETRGLRILMAGDMEPEAQQALAAALPGLRVDVLKVPHHGSRYQDPALLTGLGARLALVSVGRDNDYGHPALATLQLLRRAGMRVERTDLDGDVAVTVHDGGLGVRSRGSR